MESREKVPLTCPACSESFAVLRPISTPSAGETTEFRSLTASEMGTDIATCPRCGYTDWTARMSDASALNAVSDKVQRQVGQAVGLFGPPSSWSATQRYEVAARVAARAGRPKTAQALFELRVAWAAEDDGDADRALVWRREAAEKLLAALDGGELSDEDRLPTTYLAAEMLRRTGDRERAAELFGMLKVEAAGSEDPHVRRLVRLAGIQATEPFEFLPRWF